MQITATEFKAKCLKLLDQVNETGVELEITKRGRPVARISPWSHDAPWKKLRGKGRFTGDPFAPVLDESEIEALK